MKLNKLNIKRVLLGWVSGCSDDLHHGPPVHVGGGVDPGDVENRGRQVNVDDDVVQSARHSRKIHNLYWQVNGPTNTGGKERKEMFYLTTHSTHCNYRGPHR